jgi:hypothetical protein
LSQSGALVVDRRGSIMMSFMPAIGERKYDSEKKQVIYFYLLFLFWFLVMNLLIRIANPTL